LIDGHARIGADRTSLTQLKAVMRRAGVSRAVLFGSASQPYVGVAGGEFAVTVQVDPLSVEAPRLCEELAQARQNAGVELRPSRRGRWVNAPQVMPLWERLEASGVPANIALASQEYNEFSDVVTSFPALQVVIDDLGHAGDAALSQYVPILLEYGRYPQVYISLARLFAISREPHPHRDLWPVMRDLLARFGSERLVWGSGYPEIVDKCGYVAEAQLLAQLPFLTPDEVERIGEANAARLWFVA
jgi:predicted TIM-barrel fold metal-dependent hydrolase